MKQYFEKQLENGKVLTPSDIVQMMETRKDIFEKDQQLEEPKLSDNYLEKQEAYLNSKLGLKLVFYVLMTGNTVDPTQNKIEAMKCFEDEIDELTDVQFLELSDSNIPKFLKLV